MCGGLMRPILNGQFQIWTYPLQCHWNSSLCIIHNSLQAKSDNISLFSKQIQVKNIRAVGGWGREKYIVNIMI